MIEVNEIHVQYNSFFWHFEQKHTNKNQCKIDRNLRATLTTKTHRVEDVEAVMSTETVQLSVKKRDTCCAALPRHSRHECPLVTAGVIAFHRAQWRHAIVATADVELAVQGCRSKCTARTRDENKLHDAVPRSTCVVTNQNPFPAILIAVKIL